MPKANSIAKRHPVNFVADELGVERGALTRRLKAAGVDYGKGITFREAFSAWTARDERDADRARQQKAEADTAEVTAAEKLGKLMLKKDAALLWADATIEVRKLIQAKPQWKSAELLTALSKLKLEPEK